MSSTDSRSRGRSVFGLGRDDVPTVEDVAKIIAAGKAKRILVMAGAGISTAAGIPDFRSPETGLYANLAKYELPYPEAIFDIDYFQEKPQAFYTLAKELYPGNFKPTLTHYWLKLMRDKGILKAVFTQNIDTLERVAGLEDDDVIEAHGSFASAECLSCQKQFTKEAIKPQIMRGEVVYCDEARCKGKESALVKPKIVFFGEGLPKRFFDRLSDFATCDLLIVLGTSLTVQPFASLINRVPTSCPRLLLNLESVGEASRVQRSKFDVAGGARNGGPPNDGFDFDGRTGRADGIRDVRGLGTSDEGVRRLCKALGWENELDELKRKGWAKLEAEMAADALEKDVDKDEEQEDQLEKLEKDKEAKTKDEDDVDALTAQVGGVKLEEEQTVEPAPAATTATD